MLDVTDHGQRKLENLRQDLQGTCWWCGGEANSHEHKFKKSDLDLLSRGEPLYWSGVGTWPGRTLQGYKRSKFSRFGRVLCEGCNNARSQPFDMAYQQYSEFITANHDWLWRKDGIRFDRLFGNTWETDIKSLARYFCKNVGCLMADSGFQPPDSLINFMNGDDDCCDVGIYLMKSEERWLAYKGIRDKEASSTPFGLWIEDGIGLVKPAGSELNGYIVSTYIGYVGMRFHWERGTGPKDSFFLHPHPVMNKVKARPELRRILKKQRRLSSGGAAAASAHG